MGHGWSGWVMCFVREVLAVDSGFWIMDFPDGDR